LDVIGRPSCPHRYFNGNAWFRQARHRSHLVAVLLGACLNAGRQKAEPTAPAPEARSGTAPQLAVGLEVPGTFSRDGSCGGDWGDEVFLTLLPDGVFSLRQIYRDAQCAPQVTLLYMGRWVMAPDGRQLRLDNGPAWLRRVTIVDRRTLRIPEAPDTTTLPVYQTAYPAQLVPFRDPFRLQGLVSLAPLSQ
jgi:hypothetical protein